MNSMGNLMDEYEAELLAKGKAEIAAEDAAFNALPREEQQRILAERAAKMADFFESAERQDGEPMDDDDDVEDDE